ncbi:uncharacterized protein LOC106457084 [Limulus polyphemus]|uniref:Uncharacterized protein LOC106457084 n=1 Tax=Limulus polyphemus TaxID=6850 RepID=A0ABM1AZV4_LIMPO|nr:uncharacterized protein LOC106457084 [Limulus polyphemus]
MAPKNDAVNNTDREFLSQLPGQVKKYKSVDTVPDTNEAVNYPTKFLNSLESLGVPPHNLELKYLLFRYLDSPTLCNGTRLAVKRLMPHVIEAKILIGHAA